MTEIDPEYDRKRLSRCCVCRRRDHSDGRTYGNRDLATPADAGVDQPVPVGVQRLFTHCHRYGRGPLGFSSLAAVAARLVRSLADETFSQVRHHCGHPLCPHAVASVDPVLRRRSFGDRQQRRRTCLARRHSGSQKLFVRRFQCWGERAAILYSLIGSAKNGLDPESYLRQVLTRIADHPIRRIEELLQASLTKFDGAKTESYLESSVSDDIHLKIP
jgi:IS66 C-terminal element